MRKPCSLLQDLFTLISEAAFEPQRNLHFPLFRHAGTRIVKPRRRRGRTKNIERLVDAGPGQGEPSTTDTQRGSAQFVPVQSLVPRAGGNGHSPQMDLFAAVA